LIGLIELIAFVELGEHVSIADLGFRNDLIADFRLRIAD